MNLKFGRVVWFNKVKEYGFVKPDGEDIEIFLRFDDGRAPEIKNSEIAFSELDVQYNFPFPRTGDSVCFLVSKGSKGRPKCSPWCFSTKYSIVKAYIEKESTKFQIGDVDQFEFEKCDCGHYFYEHCGEKCQIKFCHCGDEDYEDKYVVTILPDGRQGVLIDDYSKTNHGDTPGGFHIYE